MPVGMRGLKCRSPTSAACRRSSGSTRCRPSCSAHAMLNITAWLGTLRPPTTPGRVGLLDDRALAGDEFRESLPETELHPLRVRERRRVHSVPRPVVRPGDDVEFRCRYRVADFPQLDLQTQEPGAGFGHLVEPVQRGPDTATGRNPCENGCGGKREHGLDVERLLPNVHQRTKALAKKLDRPIEKNGYRMFAAGCAYTIAHGKAKAGRKCGGGAGARPGRMGERGSGPAAGSHGRPSVMSHIKQSDRGA